MERAGGRVLKTSILKFKDLATSKNNKLAIKIHCTLSIIGFLSASVLGDSSQALFPVLIPLIGGSLIYVIFGFMFLEPTGDKAHLSVSWLFGVTFTAGSLSTIGYVLTLFADPANSNIVGFLTSALLGAAVFFNTVGMGILALCYEIGLPADSVLGLLIFIPASFLAPALLLLGLRVKSLFPDED